MLTYDDIGSMDPSVRSLFVDVAGDAVVRRAVHEHLGEHLAVSLTVGMTHWDALDVDGVLPGPEPQGFFAPAQIEKRMREWGRDGHQARLGAAWSGLLDVVGEWIRVVEVQGLDALRREHLRMLDGQIDPSVATMVVVGE